MPRGRRYEVGHKFGHYEIIGYDDINNKYHCKCDCGNVRKITAGCITRGETKSCGCRKYDHRSASIEAINNIILSKYRLAATRRGYEFLLPKDHFSKLILQNCFYCDKEPEERNVHFGKRVITFRHNGVDRSDNSLGYTVKNSVACCKFCNIAKSDLSVADFIQNITKIAKHQGIL